MSSAPLILGVARTHDVAAALIRGHDLLVLSEAERVLDEKHARGPEKLVPAIEAALAAIGAHAADIAGICIADTGREQIETTRPDLVAEMHGPGGVAFLGTAESLTGLPLGGIELPGLPRGTPVFASCHHASHAAGSVFLSGYGSCLNTVVDGYGTCCGTIQYAYRGRGLERLHHTRDRFLLGWRYQLFGHFVSDIDSGATDNLDLAGKVMGLNAYGVPDAELVAYYERWFAEVDMDSYSLAWRSQHPHFADVLPPHGLFLDCGSARDPRLLNAIASMQEAFSRTITRYCVDGLRDTGLFDLTHSGGCALNVLANTRLAGNPHVQRLYVQPSAGDNGLPVGAAALLNAHMTGTPLHAPKAMLRADPYRGVGLTGDLPLLGDALPADDLHTVIRLADHLQSGKTLGMALGRAEIGPRALGHRSIFAFPNGPSLRDTLNRIKRREWWRPFAPVCRLEDASLYFDAPAYSPYMLLTANVRPAYRRQLAAASHEDGTARLQVLEQRADHPLLWDILAELKSRTDVGVLVNTSFNMAGKPLLNRASTALQILETTALDAIWLEGRFIASPGN